MSQRQTLRKASHFIAVEWPPSGEAKVTVATYDLKSIKSGTATRAFWRDLKFMSDFTEEEKVNCFRAAIDNQPDGVNYELEVEQNHLAFKSVDEGFRMTLGKIPLHVSSAETAQWMTTWLLDLIMAQTITLECLITQQQETEVMLGDALQHVDEMRLDKEQMEKELFTKFSMIVNAKKQKIKALQKAVTLYEEALKNVSQGTSEVTPPIQNTAMELSSDDEPL